MNDMTAVHKDKLMHDLRVVITDAEELLRVTADQVGEGVTEVRGRIQSRLATAKAELVHLQSVAVAKAKEAGHAAASMCMSILGSPLAWPPGWPC